MHRKKNRTDHELSGLLIGSSTILKRCWTAISIWICGSLLFAQAMLAQQAEIRIVYPDEEQEVFARDSTFIFGSVTPSSQLWINGTEVSVLPNGAFLAFLPVTPGVFVFECRAVLGSDTTSVDRSVFIPYRMKAFPVDSLGFDTTYAALPETFEFQPGDLFEVSVKGTPRCRAFFDIVGLAWNIPMTERRPLPRFPWGHAVFGDLEVDTTFVEGLYTGVYQIQPWDMIRDADVRFLLVNSGSDTVCFYIQDVLTVTQTPIPRIAVLTEETVIARPGPGQAYTWFLPRGVKVWVTGRRGIWYRVILAGDQEAWIPEGSFRMLPPGTPVPRGVVSVIRTESRRDRVRISIPLGERLPYHIRQRINPSSLILTLYGAWSDTDWIPQDFDDPMVRDIRWTQVSQGVYRIEIHLNQEQQWGYDPFYDGTTLQLDVMRRPRIARWPESPFKDLVICLDPGHHPDPGAIGPTGLEERTVNLGVAMALKTMLEKKGAVVVMTREGYEGISLYSRPRLAAAVHADILLSIHFNALPDGVNPWRNNGSSIYYYHPMNNAMARSIHEHVLRELKLPDFGLYYANLALCRPTEMLSVLTEEAFMMIPEQEQRLAQPAFQKRCAKAIYSGLRAFLKMNR